MSAAGLWTGVWSADRDAYLTKLWSEGHSTAEIGRRMAVTKNSIVGRAHRLHLPARPSPISFNGSRKRKAAVKRAPKITIAAVVEQPIPTPVPEVVVKAPYVYVGRIGECEWPLTNGRPWRFCCKPTMTDRPYCTQHVERARSKSSSAADAA